MPSSKGDVGGEVTKPLVSVIVATHNRAHCLPRALDSIYGQQRLGDAFSVEIIVVDDGSSDNTAEVIRRYPEVGYLRLPARCGASAARNEGLRATRGDYIGFLDDDDEWLPHKLCAQVEALEMHPDVGVVYGQSFHRNGEQERLYPQATQAPSGRVFMAMLMDNFCGHHACLLVRRTALEKAGDFDESLVSYEDYDMSLRLAFHVPFLFVPGAVAIYNMSSSGLWQSRAASGLGAVDARRALEKALGLLPDSAEYAEVKRAARVRVALDSVYPILLTGNRARAWAGVLATLREHPQIARYAWARMALSALVCQQAMAATSPISTTRRLCSEIRAVTRRGGLRGRWWMRHMVAGVWIQMAEFSRFPPRANPRDAACAVVFAIAQVPFPLTRETLRRGARTMVGVLAQAMAAASPILTTRQLCSKIKAATRRSGLRGRWWMRRLGAAVLVHTPRHVTIRGLLSRIRRATCAVLVLRGGTGGRLGLLRQARKRWPSGAPLVRTSLFSTYMDHYFPNTEGWFNRQSAALWDCLLTYQNSIQVRGNLLEIGLWKGQSAALQALHRASDELLVLVDTCIRDEARTTIERISPSHVEYLQMRSRDFLNLDLARRGYRSYRWVHIDGEHTGPAVANDLEIADWLLHDGGIATIDDFMSPDYPQITRTTFEYLSRYPHNLQLFICGFRKGYLCRPAKAAFYLEFVRSSLYAGMRDRGFGDVTIFKTAEPSDLNCFGITERHGDLDYRGPDWDVGRITI